MNKILKKKNCFPTVTKFYLHKLYYKNISWLNMESGENEKNIMKQKFTNKIWTSKENK